VSVPAIAFLSPDRGVGTTTLVYHLAWSYADLGLRVVVVDLDPHGTLTRLLVDAEELTDIWAAEDDRETAYGCLRPLLSGDSDTARPRILPVTNELAILCGDVLLWDVNQHLGALWPPSGEDDQEAMRVTMGLRRVVEGLALPGVALILVDLDPYFSPLNHSALLAADRVVLPLVPSSFCLNALRYGLGPKLREWSRPAGNRLPSGTGGSDRVPRDSIYPMGYLLLEQSLRLDRPVPSWDRWMPRIPREYSEAVLHVQVDEKIDAAADPNCIGVLRDFSTLLPMAREAGKPVFHLTPSDGALGAHREAADRARCCFHTLAREIASRAGVRLA